MTSTTDGAGWLLKRAQDALNTAMTAALHQNGATLTEYAVLTALAEAPGMSNAGVARRAYVSPQTMNQVLRELEHRGWASRHPHPGHGRILQAGLNGPRRAGPGGMPPGGGRGGGTDPGRAQPRQPRAAGRGPAELYRRARPSVKGSRVCPLSSTQTALFSV